VPRPERNGQSKEARWVEKTDAMFAACSSQDQADRLELPQ